jgi:hypothetical protein
VHDEATAVPPSRPAGTRADTRDASRLRAFGRQVEDLDVDFGAPRAEVVTQILTRCTGSADDDVVWWLTVRDRLHALVVVCRLTCWRSLTPTLACPGCAERVELELPLDRLADAARQGAAREPVEVEWRGDRFRPRLPTGADLRRWSAAPPGDAELLAALGGPHLADDELPTELLERVQAALAEADPLVDVRVDGRCPGCGAAVGAAVDVERETVELLRGAQDELVAAVAALARAFGWSEREIVELPPSRRRCYLELLGELA